MFLSFGNLFMFGGLLATLPAQERFDEFDYFHTSDRVLRMEGGSNPGITEIVLREW